MSFETLKKNLDTENQYLRTSLEKEEKALSSLQEELRKLREQIRILEDKGTSTELVTENQKLKQHLEEEKLKTHSFLNQREMHWKPLKSTISNFEEYSILPPRHS